MVPFCNFYSAPLHIKLASVFIDSILCFCCQLLGLTSSYCNYCSRLPTSLSLVSPAFGIIVQCYLVTPTSTNLIISFLKIFHGLSWSKNIANTHEIFLVSTIYGKPHFQPSQPSHTWYQCFSGLSGKNQLGLITTQVPRLHLNLLSQNPWAL